MSELRDDMRKEETVGEVSRGEERREMEMREKREREEGCVMRW